MNTDSLEILRKEIAPQIQSGRCALLLGAGFSYVNSSIKYGPLADGTKLISDILKRCGKTPGSKTTLKDAYQYGKREDKEFDQYFTDRFTVGQVFLWQSRLFQYPWARLYTTNIDNVLNIALSDANRLGKTAGEFKFFNYSDEGLISNTIGCLPVITIHGTAQKLSEGFIFSSLEYSKAASKTLDWHNDLAAWMLAGGLLVIGNQLDESDFDTYLSRRESQYTAYARAQNWIVMPDPDPIKSENYIAAGFKIIDATAEEFFTELYRILPTRTIGDIVISTIPTAARAAASLQAMTWFKGSFSLVFDAIEHAKTQQGILRHYLTGVDPDWFYIINNAHATTTREKQLADKIQENVRENATGTGILHILGPSGSGKTTALKEALIELSRTVKYIYEFDSNKIIDEDFLKQIIERFQEKSVFVFYSSADYFYAIRKISDRLKDREIPYCLFILEDRISEYNKNARHLTGSGVTPTQFHLDSLSFHDARSIAIKMEEAGLRFELFSEFDADHRARIILDKERGFSGDLLSTMFSLTTHENFEQKIYRDYTSVSGQALDILNLVAMINAQGHEVPLEWIAGGLGEKFDTITRLLKKDLAGIVIISSGSAFVKCRHRIIAEYYFKNCIQGKGKFEPLVGILEYLSRQFSVPDIKYHPLSYKVYRDLITLNFLYDKYFPIATRQEDCERTYHELQKYYGTDGIFWLQFGRFYRRTSRLKDAVDCFRIGLEFYNSYQTQHALGQATLEQFIEGGGKDHELYNEGVQILDRQQRENSSDPYPMTTLIDLLWKVLEIQPNNDDASLRIKDSINTGMKKFRKDSAFMDVAIRAMSSGQSKSN